MIEIRTDTAPETGTKILDTGIASDLSLKTPLAIRVMSALIEAGCLRAEDRTRYETCFEEAIINAIEHGNREDPRKLVTVRIFVDGGAWRVHISDEGAGFAPEKVTDPSDPGFPWLERGRGIHMIRHLAGSLEYYAGGRTAVIEGTSAQPAIAAAPAATESTAASSAAPPRRAPVAPEGTHVIWLLPEDEGGSIPSQIDGIACFLGERPQPLLVLDLSALPYLASIGIGALVRLAKTCRRFGTRFALVGVSPELARMLGMMQIDRFIPICGTPEEAADAAR
jgi:serine/threonine-protein kinase RsbW